MFLCILLWKRTLLYHALAKVCSGTRTDTYVHTPKSVEAYLGFSSNKRSQDNMVCSKYR